LDVNGQLLGLVTSNARHSKTGSSLPNLNFSLSTQALWPLWQRLLERPQPKQFKDLDVTSLLLQKVWALSSHTEDVGRSQPSGGMHRLQHLLQQKGLSDVSSFALTDSRL
jgi:hypothetical protein